MASKQNARKSGAQNSAKRGKKNPRGKPFTSDNPYKFQSRAENGGQIDPRINAGGRPKLLGESYKAMLARVNESDPLGRTNAELIAEALKVSAMQGDVSAAREIRAATEGERIRTWRDEVIDLLKARAVTPQEVEQEVGTELARELFIAAGIARNESGEIAGDGAQTAKPTPAKS